MLKCLFIIISLMIANFQVYASCNEIRDYIPLDYCKEPAGDLVCPRSGINCTSDFINEQGRAEHVEFSCEAGDVLDPEEAHALQVCRQSQTKNTWSISSLDPESTTLWKDNIDLLKNPSIQPQRELGYHERDFVFDDYEQVDFENLTSARSGFFRINVKKGSKSYLVYVGTKTHNFLMNRMLLRKLGYIVPMVKRHSHLVLNFDSKFQRENFISSLTFDNSRDSERWVTESNEKSNQVTLQDVVVLEDQNEIQNLAIGYLTPDLIDSRRTMRSLLIPYSILDVPENIQFLSPTMCRELSRNVVLKYSEYPDSIMMFETAAEDARWITERMMYLSEIDWEEIVAASQLPENEQLRLIEAVKSRRNSLATCFGVHHQKLEVDFSKVQELPKVEFYKGFGRRFHYEDPTISLLGLSEMESLLKSRFWNKVLDTLVNLANSKMTTDLESRLNEINERVADNFAQALKDKTSLNEVIESYAYPTVGGSFNLSRSIVAGSYLGTDNAIQIVDNIGARVNIGMFAGISGIFAKTGKSYLNQERKPDRGYSPLPINASASAYVGMNWSHVRPITSMQKKYKWTNLLVPIVKAKYAKSFNELAKSNFDKKDLEEQNLAFEEMMKILNTNMNIGESFIVTNNLGVNIAGEIGATFYEVLKANLRVSPSTLVLSRLHIIKRSETEFHIFKSYGNVNSLDISLGMSALVPIAKVSVRGDIGRTKTSFYKVDLSSSNKKRKQTALALRSILKNGRVGKFEKISGLEPVKIIHKFKQGLRKIGITVFNWFQMNSADQITVRKPNRKEVHLYRRYKGHSVGINYESYANDLISSLIARIRKKDYTALNFSPSNPGYTFFGKAKNKVMLFEGLMNDKGQVEEPYVKLSRIWNGWSSKRKKLERILEKIKKRYSFGFYSDHVLSQTDKIFLYQIHVDLYFHEKGIAHMLSLSDEQLKEIFKKYQTRDSFLFQGEDKIRFSGYKRFLRIKKRYFKAFDKNNIQKYSNKLVKLISIAERKLSVQGIQALVGSDQNFFAYSYVDGFRDGDASADQDGQRIYGNSLGHIGEKRLVSPTEKIRTQLGITAGEFYINWIMGRIL